MLTLQNQQLLYAKAWYLKCTLSDVHLLHYHFALTSKCNIDLDTSSDEQNDDSTYLVTIIDGEATVYLATTEAWDNVLSIDGITQFYAAWIELKDLLIQLSTKIRTIQSESKGLRVKLNYGSQVKH